MTRQLSRRRYVVGTGAALTTGALAGCSGGGGGDGGSGGDGSAGEPADDVPSEIDDYLSENEARLYEGTIADYTGEDEVVVDVGAGEVGFAFDPAAIRIDAGTTVVWEWTGQGGAHNVASAEGSDASFDSGDAIGEEGTTFERTFEEAGIQLYYCTPHQANGMHGAIEIVE
ncbi:halocyanin domain-containing protein [Halorubrum cibi]|uniref:Halocyanin domain-containing protein n=1 Tax=Halorubrum cibi TaxID=413815 RepID=A0A521DDG0_9EURY|nr:halocyanin domain-containing protein [Halorubrum cibi]SMO69693.1 halocyanin domain-containing protein [Halorubrum cibi]